MQTRRIRIGCTFTYMAEIGTPVVFHVQPRNDPGITLTAEELGSEPQMAVRDYTDLYGNPVKRLVMPPGPLLLRYDAVVGVPDGPDPDARPPAAAYRAPRRHLHFTLPSRYCQSDQLGDGLGAVRQAAPGGARVQAVCDWVHDHIQFQYGTSNPDHRCRGAREPHGVCRDLAHLAISFCRALNIPARYVFGYLPDLYVPADPEPMDFAAWMEVWLGDRWWTFDPRNNQRRVGRVLIGRPRRPGRGDADDLWARCWRRWWSWPRKFPPMCEPPGRPADGCEPPGRPGRPGGRRGRAARGQRA